MACGQARRRHATWALASAPGLTFGAGMPHVNLHDLRHSCASILVGLGVDLYTITKAMGSG
jgi:integrase